MKQFQLYDHYLGARSRRNVEGVYRPIVKVVELGARLSKNDITIVENGGVRSEAVAAANEAAGKGIKDSRHRIQADGKGHAIDHVLFVDTDSDGDKEATWDSKYVPAYRELARCMKIASAILLVPVRQGCDWNMNGVLGEPGTKEWDWVHIEDPIDALKKRAEAEMLRFREELSREGWDLTPPAGFEVIGFLP